MGRVWQLLAASVMMTVALAGCADSGPADADDDGFDGGAVDATETTGGIRGVVVDASVVPIADVVITVINTELTATTDEGGTFVFSGLEPGSYFVESSHPLYGTEQTSAEVVAGEELPEIVKIQMQRISTIDPYVESNSYKGYISCSANILVPEIGGVLSEECGEGVGYPCSVPVTGTPVPATVYECNDRMGKVQENQAQIDFFTTGEEEKTIIAEAVWVPALNLGVSETGESGGFNMGIYTEFGCDPWCGWDKQLDRADGQSPLYLRSDTDDEGDFDGDTPLAEAEITPETRLSTFTWASSKETGMLLQQDYEVFVSTSYVLELPEGWSFVNDDPKPF